MAIKTNLIMRHWVKNEKQDLDRIAQQTPTQGVTQLKDIPYIPDGHTAHLLDVYYPEGTREKLPVIINIHGGGFSYGYKELNLYHNLAIAKQGYTVFSLNYRVAPESLFLQQAEDLNAALCWIAQHGAQYPADMQNIYLTGDSAGGMHAMLQALLERSEQLRGIFGVRQSGLSIRALGLISGGFVLTKGLGRFLLAGLVFGKGYAKSPAFRAVDIRTMPDLEQLPPCYLVTSAQDFVQSHSHAFAKLLQEKQVPYLLRDWPKAADRRLDHVFSVTYPHWEESRAVMREMLNFFQHYAYPNDTVLHYSCTKQQ